MLWQASNEVMLDMWRARFGNERVDLRILYNEKVGGDTNDWPYVARVLRAISAVTRHEPINGPGVFYQLKE